MDTTRASFHMGYFDLVVCRSARHMGRRDDVYRGGTKLGKLMQNLCAEADKQKSVFGKIISENITKRRFGGLKPPTAVIDLHIDVETLIDIY